VIVAAAVCPSPPLLLREVTGATDVAADLRAACLGAVATLVAAGPDAVHVVGPAGPDVTARSYAPHLTVEAAGPARPLGLLLGERMLAESGWAGSVQLHVVDAATPPEDCAALGARLAGGDDRVGMLVLGDGSARRQPTSPGYVDERALGFDAEAVGALRAGNAEGLLALSPVLAERVLAAGRAPWQVLAGALRQAADLTAADLTAEVLYADDPFGVLYLVATVVR
jgi:hypothetical protein